jgi:hypothetical protein
VVAAWSGPGLAEPVRLYHPMTVPHAVPNLINSHVVYLNRCAQGCLVTPGDTDSRTDHSDIAQNTGTITSFSDGDAKWTQVMDCVKNVMAPFNITVTDVDPGAAEHFEIMIGGDPSNIGLPQGVGGIADYPCMGGACSATYVPDALVFDFSNVWQGDVLAICGTAAQEIAHAWTLDHATPTNDPMTYHTYTMANFGYKDGAQCGSDCLYNNGTTNAFGVQCVGTGYNGTHPCTENGQATQDEIQMITKLFGPAGAVAPTVSFQNPTNGAGEQAGFGIDVNCTSGDGVQEVDVMVDGALVGQMFAPPFHFVAPGSLSDGTHHITALCGSNKQATATASVDVITGPPCTKDPECATNNLCYEHVCIAGPDATGGLGSTCTGNDACASGTCAGNGSMNLCVIPCDVNNDQCPSGFGCLSAGTTGVCWLGAEKGGNGGCCDSSGRGAGGSVVLGLSLGAILITRRRRVA